MARARDSSSAPTMVCIRKMPAVRTSFGALLLSIACASVSPNDTPLVLLTARQGTCTSNMFAETAAQVEGPFYFTAKSRKDITDSLPGAPLTLRLAVKGRDCRPFPSGSVVNIWHAAANGTYSGYVTRPDGAESPPVNTEGVDFLRGEQTTDADGVAEFKTIVPGWYVGRPVHIHVKVLYTGGELTTQIYFPEDTIAAATETSAYRARGMPRTSNEDEAIPAGLIQKPKNNRDGTFSSNFSIGIDVDVKKLSTQAPSVETTAAPTKTAVGTTASPTTTTATDSTVDRETTVAPATNAAPDTTAVPITTTTEETASTQASSQQATNGDAKDELDEQKCRDLLNTPWPNGGAEPRLKCWNYIHCLYYQKTSRGAPTHCKQTA